MSETTFADIDEQQKNIVKPLIRSQLKKGEKILLITRQHWIKLLLPFIAWLLVVVMMFVFLPSTIAFVITFVSALYPLNLFLGWKNNLWAVTNMRIIDESGFISRYSKESPLEKINNVEYDQSPWGRMFGYGDVEIQTAAEMGDTTYRLIHHPRLLKNTITQAQEDYKHVQIANQANQLANAIKASMPAGSTMSVAGEIEKLFSLYQKGAITQEEYIGQKNKLLSNK
ncbi:MAG: PH domain-containing protein [Chitinophagaceae bacterium]|nr:PH domain-containing protein [Chitinophagaceae bacterium]